MNQACKQCSANFEITDDDLAFYEKVSPIFNGKKELIPPPTLCPQCRVQKRFIFRNERKLYHRKCDLTGKQLVSVYSPEKPYIVYEPTVWWSDAYDPLAYGRDFDFSRPFFEQFHELNLAVPKSAIQNANSENSEYTNYSSENKNSYMAVGSFGLEDCLYCYRSSQSSDLVDCYELTNSQLCYECSQSKNVYGCGHCQHCENCNDCFYCDNCTGCKDCFGCINLRNAQFQIYNTQYSEAEYRTKVTELKRTTANTTADIRSLHLSVPHRPSTLINCEECTGDQQFDCRHCEDCYVLKNAEDARYCAVAFGVKDSHDANFADNIELHYNSTNLHNNYHVLFGVLNWYDKEIIYCMNTFNSRNCFGCTGLKKQEYCVLNKQYTKEEYEELVPKIIEHMRSTGEWSEFFPMSISPFAYNEAVTQEYFPMSREDVLGKGWTWREESDQRNQYLGPDYVIPNTIEEVSDDITKQILRCEVTGNPYKIIPQELKFYRKMNIAIPKKCPDERHKERMALQNPWHLWQRECAKCRKPIETTYAPDRPEIVYCEECYLSTVY